MTEYDNKDTGALFKNQNKTQDKQPDYTGEYTTQDGQKRRIAAWIRESKSGKTYMSLKFSDMQAKPPKDYGAVEPEKKADDGFLDDLPF